MEALRSSFLHSSPFNSKPRKLKTHPPTILCCLKRDPWSFSSGNMNIPKPKSINPFPNDNTRRIIKSKAQSLSALRRDQGSRIQTPKWIKRTLEQMVPYLEEDRIGHLYGRHVVAEIKRVLSISGMREGEYDIREVMGSFVAKIRFREMYVVLKEQKSWRQVRDFFQWMKLQMDGVQEPLLKNDIRQLEDFSVVSAIFPFLFPAFGGLLFGYDIGATSSATISIQSETLSGISWFNLSSLDVGLITSGSLYGALIGSILAFNIADFLGRRGELVLSSLMYLIGALLTALAPNFAVMVIGRLIFGVGIGLAMHAAPMYIAETAPSQIRGLLISLKECFIVLGVLGGYVAGSLLVDTVSGWRYVYGISFPLSIIMGIGMWWLPESPRWILLRATQGKGDMQGLRETAITCLGRLRGEAIGDSATQKVDEILSELSYLREEGEATFSELFQGKCLKALTIGGGLVLFQQITGQPSVLYYAATIFQSAGFSAASDATKVSVLLGGLKLTMTGLAVLVVDRLGRRPLLLGGVSGIVLSLFLLGSYYTYLNDIPALAVVALLVYVGCYQISFGPIGWLMISEIFPLRLRGRGLSIAVLINFGANALVTFAFSPLKELLGAGNLFFIFGGIAVLSLIFIFFVIPETKGLTLEEIEDKLL